MYDEESLRPSSFDSYIGQHHIRENLQEDVNAALLGDFQLKHLLFHGGPGLGKTTLARIIASMLDVDMVETAGPALASPDPLVDLLLDLNQGDVLFIDEIHRMGKKTEEILYPALEDGMVTWVSGKGKNATSLNVTLPDFTLVGATTRLDLVAAPLRDRFGEIYNMVYYTIDEMCDIVERTSHILSMEIDDHGIEEIAKRARGTPRIANRLAKNVRDFALVNNTPLVTAGVVDVALTKRGIDPLGLNKEDHKILRVMRDRTAPVGLETLAAAIHTEPGNVANVHEPFLLQCGLMERTSRGRIITDVGRQYLSLSERR